MMKQLATGRPRRQPDTELLFNPLPHTDVTRHKEGRITYPPLEQTHYRRQLELQIQEKQKEKQVRGVCESQRKKQVGASLNS